MNMFNVNLSAYRRVVAAAGSLTGQRLAFSGCTNDCWPASGWSVVDYYGFRKAGFMA